MLYHGYLVVEFFFILSGFLMYRSFCRSNIKNPCAYLISRFKRFFKPYVICLLLCIAVHFVHAPNFHLHLYDIVYTVMAPLCDALMLHSIGVFNGVAGWNNNPTWYLSVLVFGGSLVYGCIYCMKKIALGVILPLFCIAAYTKIFNTYYQLEVWDNDGWMYMGMIRGIADISLGALVGAAFHYCREDIEYIVKRWWVALFALVGTLLVFVVWMPLDQYSLVLFPLLILCSFSQNNVVNKLFKANIWSYLGALSWYMFLTHYIVLECMDFFIPEISPLLLRQVVYLLIVLLCSVGLELVGRKLLKRDAR